MVSAGFVGVGRGRRQGAFYARIIVEHWQLRPSLGMACGCDSGSNEVLKETQGSVSTANGRVLVVVLRIEDVRIEGNGGPNQRRSFEKVLEM